MNERWVILDRESVRLTQGEDGFYRDLYGTIYALEDTADSTDPVVRIGVGPFSLPTSAPETPAAIAHDYAYSCPVYQAFHTREEADLELKRQLEELDRGSWREILATPFYYLARIFGGFFWENKKTV